MTVSVTQPERPTLFSWTAASLVLLASIVGIALFAVTPTRKAPASGFSIIVGLACLAPYVAVLALVAGKRRPSAVALGFAYGLSAGAAAILITLAVVGTVGRVVVLMTMWSSPIVAGLLMGLIRIATALYYMGPVALVLMILFGVAQFQLARAAKQAYDTERGRARNWSIGRVFGFVTLGAGAFVTMSGQSKAEETTVRTFITTQEQRRSEDQTAYHALLRLQACAATYADSSPAREYPPTLAALGPGGSNCLDTAVAGGAMNGYLLRYHPIPDSSGRPSGWWAIARRPNAQRSDDAFMADYAGALYRRPAVYDPAPGRDEADTAVMLYPYNALEIGNWVRSADCIRDMFATAGPGGGYPSELASVKHEDWRTCLVGDKRNRVVWGDYLVSYVPAEPDRSGKIRSFGLHATPLHYGRDAVRSFLIEPDSVIHVTASQRRATAADPLYTGCELNPKVPCRIAQ